MKPSILIIIPARGGSKGIPRKNLRSLNGKPLIFYSIACAQASKYKPDIYVSTEDLEIGSIALKLGAKTQPRKQQLSSDAITLDPVIFHAWKNIEHNTGNKYELIVTMQPTSPLLRAFSLDSALDYILQNPHIDTILSAKDDTHLSWRKENDNFVPNYKERVNRQYLTPVFTETGGFVITRPRCMSENNRIGKTVHLHLLGGGEEVDVDTHADWNLCEHHLRRKKILFVVAGYPAIGLGHAYRTLILANGIMEHHVSFLVTRESELAYELISSFNYEVYLQEHENLYEDINELLPDVVINDVLDTSVQYMKKLKELRITLINFEDLGEGSLHADLIINALYPVQESRNDKRFFYGFKYFCARDEFLLAPRKEVKNKVKKLLITFGGTDENKLTRKVLESLQEECATRNITITVILGMGYDQNDNLEDFVGISVIRNVNNISDYMLEADIIFTSAGRTVFEISCIGTPTIILAQNQRETTHFFSSKEHGFWNLGLGSKATKNNILEIFQKICKDITWRQESARLMEACDVRNARHNVMRLIKDTIEKCNEIQ